MRDKNKVNNLVLQKIWDDSYLQYPLNVAKKTDPVRIWLEEKIPRDKKTCFEIGCFPGRYLAVFGIHGYELNGIDSTPRINNDLLYWLKTQKFKIGKFYNQDFLKFRETIKFDVVCSFGFIEHFVEWKEIIRKHTYLVNNEGYLIISTPNFRGFVQKHLHKLLDNENYNRHNLCSMNPGEWKIILEKEGFEVIYYGYFGGFKFWTNNSKKKIFEKIISKILTILFKNLPNSEYYSSFCGIVAKKI